MSWIEKDSETNQISKADAERAKLLSEVRRESLPTIRKEAKEGYKPFEQLSFQPVKSPGIYEAEFGVKGGDIIFHFWPFGYHMADVQGKVTPRFSKEFLPKLTIVMQEVFGHGYVEVSEDKDMGAAFVRVRGWGDRQFYRELAIKACEHLHKALGGTEG